MPSKQIVLLLSAIFVAGIGLGITLPVLPFYAERLMGTSNLNRGVMPLHITGLTSVYALTQFLFAPFWGAWSDRVGRKRMICLGILGTALSQVLFGLSNSLPLLYGARILGGLLSASLIPAATAYIADLSTDENRSRHMAWLGTVSSLATVAGLAFGAAITPVDFHFITAFWHFRVDAFSTPFFFAALLMILTTVAVVRWLPESMPQTRVEANMVSAPLRIFGGALAPILLLAIAGQVDLTAFEATFPLFAQKRFGYGFKEVGTVFMVCGLVMAVFQVVAVGYAARRISAPVQLSLGFAMMGAGILLLLRAYQIGVILTFVGVLALGMAFIAPNLAALSARGRGGRTGAAMGLLGAANSLGQAGGPLIGGALYAWRIDSAYLLSGILMLWIAIVTLMGRNRLMAEPEA